MSNMITGLGGSGDEQNNLYPQENVRGGRAVLWLRYNHRSIGSKAAQGNELLGVVGRRKVS